MPQTHPIVIATYSRRMRLQLADGEQVDARIKGKRQKPVCGDRVIAEPIEQESDWLITSILERDNELTRPDARGQTEVLAANIDLLAVVAAASPDPDWYIVDRYLCAAEDMGIAAAVVFNKTDIEVIQSATDEVLTNYAALSYPTVRCSATTGDNIAAVKDLLHGQTAIVVGQSGVGKSSIINALLDSERLRTAAISDKRGEGRHTTVNSEMLALPDGGSVIDSPGVRDYAPALSSAAKVSQGFREIFAASTGCRFNNCRHTREPGCAVKEKLADGQISNRRYDSYKRLLNLTDRLATSP